MDAIQETSQQSSNISDLINFDSSAGDLSTSATSNNTSKNDTKSTLDSSFAVADYHSSSLLDRSGENKIETVNLNGDGSDSGVEFGGVSVNNETGMLQRALSNNSAGYASSCCGLEDANANASCNSSMISYSSDAYDKTSSTILCGRMSNDYCASEGGSESSSITNGPISSLRKNGGTLKKKVAVKEPQNRSPRKSNESNVSTASTTRSRSSGRSSSVTTRTPVTPGPTAKERARSRENKTAPISKPVPPKRPPKPDSFPVVIKDIALPAGHKVTVARTPSVTRGRTPLQTPTTDDGRWPSIGNRGNTTPRGKSAVSTSGPETPTFVKSRVAALTLENKSNSLDKYATLPRRRKERSADDLTKDKNGSRSNSVSRDQIPNRMTTSLIKRQPSTKETPTKTLPVYPRLTAKKAATQKIKIYHETSVQTAITSKDVDDAFAGNPKNVRIEAVEMVNKSVQSDIRDKEMEKMEEKLKKMTSEFSTLLTKLSEKSQQVTALEQKLLQEREEKLTAQSELQNNSDRLLGLLGSFNPAKPNDNGECDSLLMLESQIMNSENVLEKKQEEIVKLQKICRTLQVDMSKSLRNQEELLRQKTELEEDSIEMQDFLQAEKISYMEALKDAEVENQLLRETICQKETEMEQKQEECRHLVRIGEQRRQELLGMQAKYNALETRSKDILLQQGAVVNGASSALSSLGSRIDSLVEQLIASYNISEQDLEDAIYHNEAYMNSDSGDGSPEQESKESPLSPQRGHSFITAVINAIRNATSKSIRSNVGAVKSTKKDEVTQHEESEDTTEMLDSETEPCLMMDNVLDVSVPDSHSHNMVSSSTRISQIEMPSIGNSIPHDESLDNLSQAIVNRQQIELQSSIMASNRGLFRQDTVQSHDSSLENNDEDNEASIAEMPSICDYYNANSLVDQVIDVDNLITKLLKVLRIVQLDNDHCIQELIGHKNRLAMANEETQDKLKEFEEINAKMKTELQETTEILVVKGNELSNSKAELVKHRQDIDRLNEDICNLSKISNSKTKIIINREDILKALKMWNDKSTIPEQELISHVVQACNEIPIMKAKLQEKERLLADLTGSMSGKNLIMTASWHQAITEAKRQYDAIDRALETLQSIQSIVQQCPALQKLQQDLEETNFQSMTTLPLNLPDLNANQMNGNDTSSAANSSGMQLNDSHIIDSTA